MHHSVLYEEFTNASRFTTHAFEIVDKSNLCDTNGRALLCFADTCSLVCSELPQSVRDFLPSHSPSGTAQEKLSGLTPLQHAE